MTDLSLTAYGGIGWLLVGAFVLVGSFTVDAPLIRVVLILVGSSMLLFGIRLLRNTDSISLFD